MAFSLSLSLGVRGSVEEYSAELTGVSTEQSRAEGREKTLREVVGHGAGLAGLPESPTLPDGLATTEANGVCASATFAGPSPAHWTRTDIWTQEDAHVAGSCRPRLRKSAMARYRAPRIMYVQMHRLLASSDRMARGAKTKNPNVHPASSLPCLPKTARTADGRISHHRSAHDQQRPHTTTLTNHVRR